MLTALTLTAALASCAPSATPTPTPSETGFASEAEAFAAAEETYRAYVDALNDVDLSDPATFEPVYALLVGEASEAARKSFSQMHSDGWKVTGSSKVILVSPTSSASPDESIDLAVCVDVSDVSVEDADGTSLVEDRPDVQSLTVVAIEDAGSSTGVKITQFNSRDGGPEC